MGPPVDSSVELDIVRVAAASRGSPSHKEAQRSPKRRRKSSDIASAAAIVDTYRVVGQEGQGDEQSINGNVASVGDGEWTSTGSEKKVDRIDSDIDHQEEERQAGGEHGQGEVPYTSTSTCY